jgi:chaperonin GroES
MANSLFIALFVIALINIAAAFNAQRSFGLRSTFSALKGNKLDGININGDLTPISNNLLIQVKVAADSTKGGLFIPDNAKERPTEGTVVAAGPGRVHPESGIHMPIAVKAGQSVIYYFFVLLLLFVLFVGSSFLNVSFRFIFRFIIPAFNNQDQSSHSIKE